MQSTIKVRQSSILLLGPTGSGKTPLGGYLEKHGLWARRCLHFDFGKFLRCIADGGYRPEELTESDIRTVAHAVSSNALLEDREFHIAEKILQGFLKECKAAQDDIIVLNGLPRHVGQAQDTDAIVQIELVAALDCPPDVVRKRILQNSGGDRTERIDDTQKGVEKKLVLYQRRTEPLIAYYAEKGIPVLRLKVEIESQPENYMVELADCYHLYAGRIKNH